MLASCQNVSGIYSADICKKTHLESGTETARLVIMREERQFNSALFALVSHLHIYCGCEFARKFRRVDECVVISTRIL